MSKTSESKAGFKIYDDICNEMVEVDSLRDARKYVMSEYTEGEAMHPDFSSFDVYQKVGSIDVVEANGIAKGFEITTIAGAFHPITEELIKELEGKNPYDNYEDQLDGLANVGYRRCISELLELIKAKQ
jgi:hypothetical protein